MTKKPKLIEPSESEDAAITSAALDDPDNPPLTESGLARMKRLPQRRQGQRGPGKTPAKVSVTLRLDPDIVAHFKRGGSGWQTRMNEALRAVLGGKR